MSVELRSKKPKIMLVGLFPDMFLEGLQELELDFALHKSSLPSRDFDPDLIVFSHDKCREALDYISKYKAVPIVVRGTKGFYDFNPLKETGNCFLYDENSAWHMFEALIRAIETYKFVYDWKVVKDEADDLVAHSLGIPLV